MTTDLRARAILWACLAQMLAALLIAPWFPLEPGLAADPGEAARQIARILEVPEAQLPAFFPDRFNSAHNDAAHYMRMAMGEPSIPPYSLRPVYPWLIGAITGSIAGPDAFLSVAPWVVLALNGVLVIGSAVLIRQAALRLGAHPVAALALGGLMAVNVGTVQTLAFTMLDIPSYAVAAVAIWCFAGRRWSALALVTAAGVLVKDVLILYAALSLYPVLTERRWTHLGLALLPLGVFIALRLASDVDPLSVQYGWNVSQGDIRLSYLQNHMAAPQVFAAKVAFALAVPLGLALWLAPPWRDPVVWIGLGVFVGVVVADLLLASRVSRIVFVAYPALALIIAVRAPATR